MDKNDTKVFEELEKHAPYKLGKKVAIPIEEKDGKIFFGAVDGDFVMMVKNNKIYIKADTSCFIFEEIEGESKSGHYCNCGRPATWMQVPTHGPSFGDTPFCDECAQKDPEFAKESPGYFWEKIDNLIE